MKTHSCNQARIPQRPWSILVLALGLATLVCLGFREARGGQPPTAKSELAPLPLVLPQAVFFGTPPDQPQDEHLEPFTDDPRPVFLAPKGVTNVAFKKRVTSSDPSPLTGALSLVTDSDKDPFDGCFVELHRLTQWVQIDLEKQHEIHVIMVWHSHHMHHVCHDVVVQVADDPDFANNVTPVFNNDYDNSSGRGAGKDKEYWEKAEGRLIDAKGVKGRYVRLYSKGSTCSGLNRYVEVEVWALPAK